VAIHLTEGDKGAYLSAAALRLYGAIARQEWESVNELQDAHPGGLEELTAWGLITTSEGQPVACDPGKALQRKLEEELEIARRLPSLARELYRDYKAAQLRTPGGSSVYMDNPAVVNARIQEIVAGARREILAAQPGGPRSRELLETAVARDTAALDRGVELRTIYRDTVRDDAVTAEYARTMSARASGRPAQYRTLFGEFERMIIVDREHAFVSDHIVENSPAHSAWLISDPAAVAVLARTFESAWRWAQPWMGELRPARGASGPDTITSADGVRTNPRQREIMRLLCSGVSQTSIAKKLGCAKRTAEADIAALKALWGVATLNELIFQYASSPDRLVDDSETAAAGSAA
jgi:sugar-specific transcriptional regulator TrmB/DNA-binding CsgD family transcriptional regulator